MTETLNVNMDGETFLKYKKQQKLKLTLPEDLKTFFSVTWIYWALAGLCSVIYAFLASEPPKTVEYVYFLGFPFPEFTPILIIISICISWIFHGFGFILVRR